MMDWKGYTATLKLRALSTLPPLRCRPDCKYCMPHSGERRSSTPIGHGAGVSASPLAIMHDCGQGESLDSGLSWRMAGRLRDRGMDVGFDRSRGEVVIRGEFVFITALKSGPAAWDPWLHPSDGMIDVIMVPAISRGDLVAIGAKFGRREMWDDDRVFYFKARSLEIEPDGAVPVNVDGEPVTLSRMEISVEPVALTLMAGLGDV